MSGVSIPMNGDSASIMDVDNLTVRDEPMKRRVHFSGIYVNKDGDWMIAADRDYLVDDPE